MKKVISMSIDPDMIDVLIRMARKNKRSNSNLIEWIISQSEDYQKEVENGQ